MGERERNLEGLAQHDAQATPKVFEVSGSIKWFNPSKGYGFIIPDRGLADVLLHITCLRRAGFQTAYEGARVVCEAIESPKGMQAVCILAMDESTAIHPSQLPQRTHVRGFGFLTRGPQTPDIFVHMETVRRCGFTELRPSQVVLARYGRGPHGLMAADIKPNKNSDHSLTDTN